MSFHPISLNYYYVERKSKVLSKVLMGNIYGDMI